MPAFVFNNNTVQPIKLHTQRIPLGAWYRYQDGKFAQYRRSYTNAGAYDSWHTVPDKEVPKPLRMALLITPLQ